LNELETIFDYVLLGLQAYSVVFSRWPAMARAYERLVPAVAGWSGPLQERLEQSLTFLRTLTRQNTEERRLKREQVYVEMYARPVSALGSSSEQGTLQDRIAPIAAGNDAEASADLQALLQQRFAEVDASSIASVVDVLMDYFRREQAMVRTASQIQQRINRLLGRQQPARALTGADLAIHYRLLESLYTAKDLATAGGRLPYLVDEIEAQLGLRVVVTGDAIEVA
jgi:hypothetical protein